MCTLERQLRVNPAEDDDMRTLERHVIYTFSVIYIFSGVLAGA